MRTLILSLAGGMALALTPAAQAAMITNGSFELASVDPGSGFTTLGNGSTAITGWTVGGDSIDYIGGYWQAGDGSRSLDLAGNGSGSISQTLTDLTPGQAYDISFLLSGNPDGGSPVKVGTISDGTASQALSYTLTGANSLSNMNWQQFNYTFTPTSTTALLTFASTDGNPYGLALDNVAITAVPEPGTWAMMLLGFGLVGTGVRRRRAIGKFAAA